MAGLNDEYEAELALDDSVPKVSDVVQPDPSSVQPGPNQPEAPKTTFLLDMASKQPDQPEEIPTIEELFGDVVPGELPDLKAEFVLINQNDNAITDASQIRNEVVGRCSVCQEDISALDAVMPGVVKPSAPLAYYTKAPTLTRYDTVVKEVDNMISAKWVEQAALLNETLAKLKSNIEKAAVYTEDRFFNRADLFERTAARILKSHMDCEPATKEGLAIGDTFNTSIDRIEDLGNEKLTVLSNKACEIASSLPGFKIFICDFVPFSDMLTDIRFSELLENTMGDAPESIKTTPVAIFRYVASVRRSQLADLIKIFFSSLQADVEKALNLTTDDQRNIMQKRDALSTISFEVNRLLRFVFIHHEFERTMFEFASEVAQQFNAVEQAASDKATGL